MRKVIKNGLVITMDLSRKEKIEKLDVVIDDNKITELVPNYEGEYDYLIDATNKIVMPGLINSHAHLGMSIFRASNDSMELMDWLNNKIWPIEDNMNDEDCYYTTLASCYEMIKTGTTTCNDMYFYCKGAIKALKETKMRILYSRSTTDNDGGGGRRLDEFFEIYNENKNDELIKFSISPHAMYTCSKEYIKECSKIAIDYHMPLHMHFCESQSEVNGIIKDYNKSPVDAIEELGLFNNKLILAHGTFLTDEELAKLKQHDVSIVHNPVSNLNLGCGIADISKYQNYVNICLGTDGQGSGNNMNMFYHMSLVDFLQKGIHQDATIMTSYDVLKMATINGAKALGFNNVGSLKKDNLADIIILDMNDIMTYPSTEIINNIVHNAWFNCVDTTMINGQILMENKQMKLTIDEEQLKTRLDQIINKVM